MSKPNMSSATVNNVVVSARLSPGTLALIEETETVVTKELPSAHLELTVQRVTDGSGSIIPRRFMCSAELTGRLITATAGTKYAAHNNLQRQVRMLGYEPMWTAVRDETVLVDSPDDEPEQQVLPFEEPEVPADESDEPGEHEDPAFGLVVSVPVLDKSCWLTPMSDPRAYKRVYLAAWNLALGLSVYAIADLTADAMNVRASIAAVMMSGDAGESIGVPARAVNPWALGTNGEREMCWVRVAKGTPDPTTKPFRSGNGEAREAYLTTLSGLPAFPEKAENVRAWREKRAARSFMGTRNATTVGARNARDDKRALAHTAGKAAKTNAIAAGQAEYAETHYKWAYCAQLRLLGEIHAEYERQLLDANVTEKDILSVMAQMKAA